MSIGLVDKAKLDALAVELAKNALIDTLSSNKSSEAIRESETQIINFVTKASLDKLHMLAERLVRSNSIKFIIKPRSSHPDWVDGCIYFPLGTGSISNLVNYLNLFSGCDENEDYEGCFVSAPSGFIHGLKKQRVHTMCGYLYELLKEHEVICKVELRLFKSYVSSIDRHFKVEERKNYLMKNKAPFNLMKLLYPEENEKVVKIRKKLLRIPRQHGRPRVGSEDDYLCFVRIWQSKSDLPYVDRFFEAHHATKLDFSVLYGLYKRNEKDELELTTNLAHSKSKFGMPKNFPHITNH
ncbi:hypothetical protein [Vibrio rotiferianus]|uniref:hypothetical protein n=1 Tax=Vibrio rotiferianus TaxID=190895 RepID=UPI0005F018EB|nr:hypothetical protein [Vibrio rotiferianus]